MFETGPTQGRVSVFVELRPQPEQQVICAVNKVDVVQVSANGFQSRGEMLTGR